MLELLVGLASPFLFKAVTLYVSCLSNNSFPGPLKKEEEEYYLRILKQFSLKNLNTSEDLINKENARNKLIEHNMRLVSFLVNKLDYSQEQNKELMSVGLIGLIKAVDHFDPDKGVRLATFAARCIRNEIFMYLRTQKKFQRETSLFSPVSLDQNDNELSLIDVLDDHSEPVLDQIVNKMEQAEMLNDLEKIPDQERQVLELRYGLKEGEESTQQNVAKFLKISRSYVSRIEKKAIHRLKKLRE